MSNLSPVRLAFKIFAWADGQAISTKPNWNARVHSKLRSIDLNHVIPIHNDFHIQHVVSEVKSKLLNKFKQEWSTSVIRPRRANGSGNKLRVYCKFKKDFHPEQYILASLPRSNRSALTQFRCGVAPIRIETGRYVNLEVNQRVCFNCNDCVEDECHVLLHCPLYTEVRRTLLCKCIETCNEFNTLDDVGKVCFILSSHKVMHLSAKTCKQILKRRTHCLYNK